MKKSTANIILSIIVGLVISIIVYFFSEKNQKQIGYTCVYSDEFLSIEYIGCVENKIPWMTPDGSKIIPVKGISLSITNKTKNSFFVSDNAIHIDGGENLINNFNDTCSYRLYAGKTQNCIFYSPSINTINPSMIECNFSAFSINQEFPGFVDYDFSFSLIF